MLSKLLGKKEPQKIYKPIRLYGADGVKVFEGTPEDLLQRLKNLESLSDDHLDLLEKNAKLEAVNSQLGNAMFEIINQETPSANATVKRMVAIAKTALFS